MKQLLYVSLFAIFLTAFTVHKFNSRDLTQMVATLPKLDSIELQRQLESDIHKLSGIQFIETSLMSKTLVMNYDAKKTSAKKVDQVLQKWGCESGKSSFRAIIKK